MGDPIAGGDAELAGGPRHHLEYAAHRPAGGHDLGRKRFGMLGDPRDLAKKLHAIFPDQSEADFYAKLTSGGQWNYLRTRAVPRDVAAVNALGEIGIEFPRERSTMTELRVKARRHEHAVGRCRRSEGG